MMQYPLPPINKEACAQSFLNIYKQHSLSKDENILDMKYHEISMPIQLHAYLFITIGE